jgi:hypothetical protein
MNIFQFYFARKIRTKQLREGSVSIDPSVYLFKTDIKPFEMSTGIYYKKHTLSKTTNLNNLEFLDAIMPHLLEQSFSM